MPDINLDTGEVSTGVSFAAKATSPDGGGRIPDNASLSGSNGVSMPGPMSPGYEEGWDNGRADAVRDTHGWSGGDSMPFADQTGDGLDHSAPANDQGVMREGFERGTSGMARREEQPANIRDFGVFSDSGNLGLGDMAENMHTYGTVGSNTDGVRSADIVGVFDAIGRGGSGGGHDGGAVFGEGQAMRGIPLGAGSGTIRGWDTANGDTDHDGY